jgi:hypothetical protein
VGRLDAPTVLLQWAAGMVLFLWVTGRRREVGIGYGWTVRGTAIVLVAGAVLAGRLTGASEAAGSIVRDALGSVFLVALIGVTAVSWTRRSAGVALQREAAQAKSQRIIEMTGIDRAEQTFDDGPEFPAWLDLIAGLIGVAAVVAAAVAAGGEQPIGTIRAVVGTLFLGAVSDAMLLGHWYLVQPGLPRAALIELVKWVGYLLPVEVAVLLVPTGMVSVFNGTIDDAYGGMLGWFWLACAATTWVLVVVTRLALKERQYSAVMAATGLLYLAILTAFGTDLVARALLAL